MKKLFIETYGCQMNVADSEVIASVMKMAGYETCESVEDADAVFLNTCSVRDNAEQKIYHRLEALNALRKSRLTKSPLFSEGDGGRFQLKACSEVRHRFMPRGFMDVRQPVVNACIMTH